MFVHVCDKILEHVSMGFHHHTLYKGRNCTGAHCHCVGAFHRLHSAIFIFNGLEVQVVYFSFANSVFSDSGDILLLNSVVSD